ncbi:MAG: serine/threonine protein kinase [Candidatus Azotimanducaceae bacterium]|jgi:serine/threonine protein kinase
MSDERPDSESEQTLIRQVPNDDKTQIRDESASLSAEDLENSAPKSVSDSELDHALDSGLDDETKINPSVSSSDKPPSNEDTIIRQPESVTPPPTSKGAATILRSPGELNKGGATILAEGANIISHGARPIDDDATIIPGGDDDSTIINSQGDDDSTIINSQSDDDSTIIGGGAPGKSDTTYIANIGDSGKSRGNTEAGRLLKNRFVLEEKIGSGGMGDVYKALDLRQQEAKERNPYIAIKILNETFARHKDAFISLQREATRTRGIPHPNIMGVFDFDREGDTVFMSMELLDGKPLDDYLKEHPEGVSIEDSWNIIDGICQGLARAHGAGIVHSDFKPGNIYYTVDKIAKVFDFGIARAVPTSDGVELESEGDATVFDAGSLGALTPTYASLEMLTGKTPTKSDDVYAVALVAYELFTGKHPYNRTPANKALDQGLQPEPIPFLKRRQWKALKKALSLKGEDRTATIDEFQEAMFSKDPPYFTYAAVATVLSVSISYGLYQQFRTPEVIPAEFTEMLQVFNASDNNINNRLNNPQFQIETWRQELPKLLNRMMLTSMGAQDEKWEAYLEETWIEDSEVMVHEARRKIIEAYLQEIENTRNKVALSYTSQTDKVVVGEAIDFLKAAEIQIGEVKEGFYFMNVDSSDNIDERAQRINTEKIRLNRNIDEEIKRINEFLGVKQVVFEQITINDERLKEENEARDEANRLAEHVRSNKAGFEKAYEDNLIAFREILLSCKGEMSDENLSSLGGIISGLEQNHPKQYLIDKPGIVAALAGCIGDRIGIVNPKRGRVVKAKVMTYLPGEVTISSIEISDKDPCAKRGLVGQGNRNRNWCEDELVVTGVSGPELVVIPSSRFGEIEIDMFATSRMEIKVSEYNVFCQSTGCQRLSGEPSNPATNISLAQANAYTNWLSTESGKVYRLPTTQEWFYAAISTAITADKVKLDSNINCTVDSRGVRLGDKLVNTQSGKPNDWGLYNYVGNAREWAILKGDNGDELFALGGAHTDPRSECTISKQIAHSGDGDMVTGFRVVRQIEGPKKAT